MRRALGLAHATHYVVSGIWPLVAYRSFEAITGPKRGPWLVKMVGLLTVVIGATIATDLNGRTPQSRRVAVGAAASYAAIDMWYAGVRGRISLVYLLDAVAELGLIAGWLTAGRRR